MSALKRFERSKNQSEEESMGCECFHWLASRLQIPLANKLHEAGSSPLERQTCGQSEERLTRIHLISCFRDWFHLLVQESGDIQSKHGWVHSMCCETRRSDIFGFHREHVILENSICRSMSVRWPRRSRGNWREKGQRLKKGTTIHVLQVGTELRR